MAKSCISPWPVSCPQAPGVGFCPVGVENALDLCPKELRSHLFWLWRPPVPPLTLCWCRCSPGLDDFICKHWSSRGTILRAGIWPPKRKAQRQCESKRGRRNQAPGRGQAQSARQKTHTMCWHPVLSHPASWFYLLGCMPHFLYNLGFLHLVSCSSSLWSLRKRNQQDLRSPREQFFLWRLVGRLLSHTGCR